MKFIIDANIVFSGILNTNSKIGDLLINSGEQFEFIAPDFLRSEIKSKYDRLVRISKMEIEQVFEAEFQVCKEIRFISEEQIKGKYWIASEKLVADIDPKDTHYIAYSKHFSCKFGRGINNLLPDSPRKDLKTLLPPMNCFN